MRNLKVQYEVGDLLVKRKEQRHYLILADIYTNYKLLDIQTEDIVYKAKTEIHTTAYKKRG